ncbi:MAG: hypothetical protein CEE43_05300 [Promethearchaeota archaeon Loki_b32]|nr:MAG: hypothetical protein CEE43_05300 [Candidatus Lokiarchaeota archaeon Loki_b32]
MKEFKVNKYITLKQEGVMSITEIHMETHTLVHWHSSIPINERNEDNTEEEFNNRCSSIQKWVESEYDKTLLPYDIAFQLLERLSDSREPIAKKVFKRDVLKGFLSGESDVVNFILGNRYLNLFSEEDLGKLFDKRNLNILSGGIIYPYNFKRLIKFDEDFAKLVLKNDINYYLKSENFEIFRDILREDLFDAFSEEEFQDFDLKKLDDALFKLLKKELDWYIEWNHHLREKFKSFQKVSKILIFRNSKSIVNFFQRMYSILNKDQKVALISYLLFDQNKIDQLIFEKIQKNLKNLDWRKISFIILDNTSHASGIDKKDFKLNENTIDLLEKYDIPFLSIVSEEIKKILERTILAYKNRQERIRFYLFGILLENNSRILREFLSKHYDDLNSEEKCWIMTTFIIYKESPEFLMKSLKKKYEQLDLIEFSQIVSSGNYVPSKQNIEKLGELGLKILLNVIIYNKYEYNFEYRDEIGKLTTNIVKDNKENLKILIIECLLASFQANSYEAIVNLFNTEIVKLLNKSDVIKISKNSGHNFLNIINKIFNEEYPPTYLEYFLSKMGPEGGDLIFKFTQKRDYLDYIFKIMREMGSDMIAPFIKNVILNDKYYEYGDWSYEFLKEFFKIYDKDQICQIFESPEYDLINRLVKTYIPENPWTNVHDNIIMFLFMAYEKLDLDIIQKINTRLTEPIKKEIFLCFQDGQDFEDSSKIKKYNDIMKILGHQNESIMDLLSVIKDISDISLFEDLKVILKDKEFTPPKNFIERLNEIRILLEERIDLFSPEDFGCEAKNYINDFFYEFEKFLQYIIFGYYSSEVKHMLKQLTHFFDCLLVLNKIIHNIVKISFHYEHMNELRNENYEHYKSIGLFLKAPAWVEKNKILSNKLNIKPRTYPAIRMRWWEEDWEKYMTERDKNLKNEFAYYFAQRKYADNIMKSISLKVIDEKLKVNMAWKLPETERKQLQNINNKSCGFKINEENVKIGLSLHRKYYRECALEFLRNIKSN